MMTPCKRFLDQNPYKDMASATKAILTSAPLQRTDPKKNSIIPNHGNTAISQGTPLTPPLPTPLLFSLVLKVFVKAMW